MKKTELINNIRVELELLFEKDKQEEILNKLEQVFTKYEKEIFQVPYAMDETRAYLITYGDSLYDSSKRGKTLPVLKDFCDKYLQGVISDIHILPMFEYTSDDGFSVIDYMSIDPMLGDWNDIKSLRQNFQLMYDFVANHLSKSSI